MIRVSKCGLAAGLFALSTALAGCETASYQPQPIQPQRASVEGSWADANGIVSTFNNGAFESRTTDSNSVVATGRYTYVSDRLVQIDSRSLLRNIDIKVNCAVVSPSQMNCTSSSGTQFSLARRA